MEENKSRKLWSVLGFFVLIGAIVLTVVVSRQQQEIRQRASVVGGPVHLSFAPSVASETGPLPLGQQRVIDIKMNTGTQAVNGFEITISLANTTPAVDIIGTTALIAPGSPFTQCLRNTINETTNPATIRISCFIPAHDPLPTQDPGYLPTDVVYNNKIASFTIQAPTTAPSTGTITMQFDPASNVTETTQGADKLDSANNPPLTIAIGTAATTTPTTGAGTPTPTIASCSQLTQRVTAAFLTECGDAGYDPVADITKDRMINALDNQQIVNAVNGANPATTCQGYLNNTTNPCTNTTPTVTPPAGAKPDLVVSNLVVSPPNPVLGSTFSISATLTNSGTANTTQIFGLQFGIVRVVGTTFTEVDDHVVPIEPPFPMGVSITKTRQPALNASHFGAGTYKVSVCADFGSLIGELNEANNCQIVDMAIGSPTGIPPTATLTPTPIVYLAEDVNRDACVDLVDFNLWLLALRGTPVANTFPDINGQNGATIEDWNLWRTAMQQKRGYCAS